MKTLLESAEFFHALGANVLPVKTGKKVVIEWDRLQSERQSIDEIKSYDWTACTGLGIVCGFGGYVCIDIDKMKGAAATSTILHELNLNEKYPWQARSGSGVGHHIWVRVAQTLPFAKGVVYGYSKDGSFDHLEVRWKDCQTLIPPSVHLSGNRYEWINGEPTAEPHEVTVESIIAAFEAVAFVKVDDPAKDKPKYKKTDYTDIIVNGVAEGQRNDTLASMSGHLRKRGLEYSEALEWLKMWNSRLPQPLPTDEVETTVTSIYSMPSSEIVLRDGMEMNLMPVPILIDIVQDMIGERSFNFLAGEEGAGKSLLAMNLSLAIATGAKKFLGHEIRKHGKVLYLNNELPFPVFLKRFKKMRMALGPPYSTQLGNFLTPEFIRPLNESWDDIAKIIQEHEPVLAILDCLYWAHNRKENDSSEMKEIMRQLIRLRDLYGVAIVVVHHTKKGLKYEPMANDNLRGSQVFSASSDSHIQLRRASPDESKRLIKATKLRNSADEFLTAHLLELDPGDLWFGDLGEVNEQDYIAVPAGTTRRKAQNKIDWDEIFVGDKVLTRQEIIDQCSGLEISERSVDRALKIASDPDNKSQRLKLLKPGTYEKIPAKENAPPPPETEGK